MRENLLLAKNGASDDLLWNALEECGIAGFFREGAGLETPLTENAGNLSGGQRQRLALARAILQDPKIFVFDEATSNVDVESEEAILSEIKKLIGKKTVLMITHRLLNVQDADRIYCMEKGKVAGCGTHEMLCESCEAYAKLWNVQRELETFGKEGMQA